MRLSRVVSFGVIAFTVSAGLGVGACAPAGSGDATSEGGAGPTPSPPPRGGLPDGRTLFGPVCGAGQCGGSDGYCYGPCAIGSCTTSPSGTCSSPSAGGVYCCTSGSGSGGGSGGGGDGGSFTGDTDAYCAHNFSGTLDVSFGMDPPSQRVVGPPISSGGQSVQVNDYATCVFVTMQSLIDPSQSGFMRVFESLPVSGGAVDMGFTTTLTPAAIGGSIQYVQSAGGLYFPNDTYQVTASYDGLTSCKDLVSGPAPGVTWNAPPPGAANGEVTWVYQPGGLSCDGGESSSIVIHSCAYPPESTSGPPIPGCGWDSLLFLNQ